MSLPPDDKPMATHSAAPRPVQLAILLLCLFAVEKANSKTNAECDRIIAELCGRKGELTGYSITAVETNILFLANSPAVRALRARPELNSKLAVMAAKGVVDRTNTVSYTYTFQDGIESIESLAKDAAGRHLCRNKQAATRELIFSSQTYLDVPVAVARASNSTSGQIWRNTGEKPSLDKECSVSTPPVWLWRGQLGEWLRQTDVTKCHRDTGPDGEEIIELTVTTSPDGLPSLPGPRLPCKVRLRSRDLTPLKFEILDANAVVESSIETEFTAFGPGLSVCKNAVSRGLRGTPTVPGKRLAANRREDGEPSGSSNRFILFHCGHAHRRQEVFTASRVSFGFPPTYGCRTPGNVNEQGWGPPIRSGNAYTSGALRFTH